MSGMRILFVSSEVYPYSKTGGLGDVAGALPAALVRLGHEVLVVSPWYQTLRARSAPLWIGDVDVPFDGGFSSCGVGTLEREGVRYAFVGHSDFRRSALYGFADDVRRFCLFSRAVPQVAARVDFVPDVIHVNDWHSAYLTMILAQGWHLPEGFPGLPSVYTVHNVQHQGSSEIESTLYWLRLPGALRESYLNHFGAANAMQAALGFAQRVTTVSPNYAQEVQRPEYGYGLDGTFRHISHKLSGILNGLDTDVWNPATDPHIAQPYDTADLSGKAKAKAALCHHLWLEPERPLLAVVSRLADQKGIDILLAALAQLLEQGWNLAILGSGEGWMESLIHEATGQYPGRIGSFIGYDEDLAHQIYAGADALVIPSRFEPCGLSQLIAMRYGTLPIARATGGLKDTIQHDKTGFLFDHANTDGLLWASQWALRRYHGQTHWQAMLQEAMAADFSWDIAAKAYEAVYRQAQKDVGRV